MLSWYPYSHFHWSIIEIAKIWKHLSINRWIDKENVAYTYIGILLSLKKKVNLVICDNMDEPVGHYEISKRSQLQDKYYTVLFFSLYSSFIWAIKNKILPYELSKIIRFKETESRMVIARGWEREMGNCFPVSAKFRLCKMNILWRPVQHSTYIV